MDKKRKFYTTLLIIAVCTSLLVTKQLSGVEFVDLLKIVIPAFFAANAAELFKKDQ